MTDTAGPLCAVNIVSGPTTAGQAADFELLYARRALARLKALIGREDITKLLAADIEHGNAFLRTKAEESGGAFRPATTMLAIRGITATQFLEWFDAAFKDEPALLAAEPEHYVQAPNADHTVTVVENLGPHVCQFYLPAYDSTPDWSAATAEELLPESEYPIRRIAALSLADGTTVGHMLTQFGDTDDGFKASLTVYFPIMCPEDIFEQHRQHLAVEFTNWILAAADARHHTTASPR